MELYLHSPIRLHGVVLSKKHRDNFTLTFIGYVSLNDRDMWMLRDIEGGCPDS